MFTKLYTFENAGSVNKSFSEMIRPSEYRDLCRRKVLRSPELSQSSNGEVHRRCVWYVYRLLNTLAYKHELVLLCLQIDLKKTAQCFLWRYNWSKLHTWIIQFQQKSVLKPWASIEARTLSKSVTGMSKRYEWGVCTSAGLLLSLSVNL